MWIHTRVSFRAKEFPGEGNPRPHSVRRGTTWNARYGSSQRIVFRGWTAYSSSADVNLAGITVDSLLDSDFVKWLLLYGVISGGKELIIRDTERMKAVLTGAELRVGRLEATLTA